MNGGMYRRTEYQLLNFLSYVAVACILGSLVSLGVFLIQKIDPYRILALILMLLGFFFELQVFMYKLSVIEQRMLHLVDLGEQHFVIAEKKSMIRLVLFYLLFWVALIGVILAFIVL